MIKESKYIIRRIIIGVGIALTLTFLNGCEVKAMTLFDGNVIPDPPSVVVDNDYPYYVSAFSTYSSTQYDIRLIYQKTNNLVVKNTTPNPWVNGYVYNIRCPFHYDSNHYIIIENCSNVSWRYQGTVAQDYTSWYWTNQEIINSLNRVSGSAPSYSLTYYNRDILFQNGTVASSFAELSPYLPITNPEFVSFNMTKRTNNNVILGYIFRPEFSDFNTNDYDYQYSFNNNGWLSLTENEQIVNINGNGVFSVRIKEKSTNDIIDSATFTITNIGTFNENVDYNIKYSGEYRTDNFQNNQVSSNSSSIIESYQIYVDYFPKSSLLKYQYQYVKDGDSLSTWNDLASSNNGSFTYTATDNGVLYARILDLSDNVLYSSTFTVSTIGDLAFDNNLGVYSGLLDKLNNKINFTGPISSIIDIPIQLILTISSGLSGGLTCSDYSLGNLMGTNLFIPCVNIKQHLGNDLYATIDLIIACCMIYHIIKMFGDMYTNLLFIEKHPIQYLGKRGD